MSRQASPGKRHLGRFAGAAIRHHLSADQLWSHFSDEGEEWVLIRVAKPQNTRNIQNPTPHKPSRLLAAAAVSVVVEG
jgi:hypothetical protein